MISSAFINKEKFNSMEKFDHLEEYHSLKDNLTILHLRQHLNQRCAVYALLMKSLSLWNRVGIAVSAAPVQRCYVQVQLPATDLHSVHFVVWRSQVPQI